MKAVLCKTFGPPETLLIEEVPSPEPGEGEIRIDVYASAVNFPDVLMIENKHQNKPTLPFCPGSEFSGVVTKTGPGVTKFKTGDRVFGTGFKGGGFAEEALLNIDRTTLIPDEMDFASAAAFLVAYGTSYYALKTLAAMQPGETLLVLGAAGGVGLSAIDLGKAMGARVIAAASSEEKLKVCRDNGADETVLYPTGALDRDQQRAFTDQIKALTEGKGVDVVYDPVGGDYSEPALRAIAWGGRFLVIGFAAGPIPKIPLNLALLKGCQIMGVFLGQYATLFPERDLQNTRELVTLVKEGKIKPYISRSYTLEEAPQALIDMASRKVTGKIVVKPR